jgi:peptide/nickel transport system permease protein
MATSVPPGTTDPASPPREKDWIRPRRPALHLWERLTADPEFLVGLVLLSGFVVAALVAIYLYGDAVFVLTGTSGPFGGTLRPENPAAPSASHPLGIIWIAVTNPATGTGWSGYDLAIALLKATPTDLVFFGGTIGGALLLGLYLGAAAGYDQHGQDAAVVNAAYIVAAVPPFFLVFVLFFGVIEFLQPNEYLPVFGLLFVLVLWPYYAIAVRARAQQIATEPFVEAARASGATRRQILWRHIIPNSFFPVFAQVPIDVYNIFFVLTAFPFLPCLNPFLFGNLTAFPTTLPVPEWGYLLAKGACNTDSDIFLNYGYWWMYTFPAAVVVLFGITVTMICDGAERFVRFTSGAR